jgi:hypothetical protein
VNEEIAKTLIGEYGWILFVGFIAVLFKDVIHNAVEAFMVFVGNDYNSDDVVYVGTEEKPARIVRVGLWKTTFYMKQNKDWAIKMVVPNERLKSLVIKTKLPTNGKLESSK